MRIAFEVYINGTHYSTRYCNPEEIMKTIEEIKQNTSAEIRRTYEADNYGNEIRRY